MRTLLLAALILGGCSATPNAAQGGHEGHEHSMNEKGQWTCSHCGGSFDGPGFCPNSYCKMALVKKADLK